MTSKECFVPMDLLKQMCDCPEIKELSWHVNSRNCVYTPTQGVIQDALKAKLDCTRHNVRKLFWAWYRQRTNKQCWTDQELWIAFYMHAIHKKVDGYVGA